MHLPPPPLPQPYRTQPCAPPCASCSMYERVLQSTSLPDSPLKASILAAYGQRLSLLERDQRARCSEVGSGLGLRPVGLAPRARPAGGK